MFRAILIDDEPLACQVVEEFLGNFPDIRVEKICHDGFEGLKAVQQLKPDLIFLDIQMPKINGFEMLELVDDPPAIIFTTAFDEYAIKAFEHHATDYLLKPFSQERFNKSVEKFLQLQQVKKQEDKPGQQPANPTSELLETAALSPQQMDRIVIRDNSNIRIIPVDDILYIEAADDYVRIVTAVGSWLKNRRMSLLEKQLPMGQFARIHRSYIVNVKEITKLQPYEKDSYVAVLRNGTKLPISKTGYPKLKDILGV